MIAVPAMTSCSARRRSPSWMPANPSPRNRKLNGSASVRTTARRPLAVTPVLPGPRRQAPAVWSAEPVSKAGRRHVATDTLGLGTIVILVPLARQSFTRSV